MVILNIGLNISAAQVDGMIKLPFAGAGTLDVGSVEKALDLMFGVGSYEYKLTSSNTEPTLVVCLLGYKALPVAAIDTLSTLLGQDCIAAKLYRAGTDTGQLIGPRASAWGVFSDEYFIEYNEA